LFAEGPSEVRAQLPVFIGETLDTFVGGFQAPPQ
jgi:hypothetical protein